MNKLWLLFIFLFIAFQLYAQKTASVSGDWSNTATWGGAAVPISTDAVIINTGITVTVDVAAMCAGITVNAAAIANGITISSLNSLTVSGAITMNMPTANVQSIINVGAGTLNAASIAIPGSSVSTSRDCIVQVSTGSINISGNITFSGAAATAQLVFTGAGTLNIGGTLSTGGTVTSFTGSTVNFNGGAQTVPAYVYNNVTLSGSGTKTMSVLTTPIMGNLALSGTAVATTVEPLTITGNLDVGTGTTFATGTTNTWTLTVTGTTSVTGTLTLANTSAKTFNNDVVVNPGGIWNETGIAAIGYAGHLQNDGTFTASTGVHTFTVNGHNISGLNEIAIPNVSISATRTNNGTLTVSTALSGTSTLTNGATGILNIGGTSAISGLTATAVGNTVNYTGTTQTIKGTTYNTLTLDGGSGTKTLGGTTTVNGTLTINSGVTFAMSTFLLTLNGDFVNNGVSTSGSGGVTITGTTNQNIGGFSNSGTISMTKTGSTATFLANVNGGALTINGTGGTLNLGIALTHTFTGIVTLTAGTLNGGSSTLNENAVSTSAWTGTGSNFTAGTGTVVFGAAGAQTIRGTATTFNNITFAGIGTTKTLLANTTMTVSGIMTINLFVTFTIAGTSTSFLIISGSLVNNGTFTPATSTVNYNAAAQTVLSATYNNLTLSGSGIKTTTGVTVNGILSMEGTATASIAPAYGAAATLQYNTSTARTADVEWITPFASTGGVIIANTGTITLNAAKVFNASVPLTINSLATLATNDSSLTFGGNFTNNGAFTAGSSPITIAGTATQSINGFSTTGTVSMTKTNGTATFTGNVNGSDLVINGVGGTLNLGTARTHTFTGNWIRTAGTLNGGSSLLQIRGSVSGTGGTFTSGTGTVEWNAFDLQTLAGVSYNNLTLSGSNLKTTTGVTVTGILSMLGNALASVAPTYGAAATLQYNTANSRTTGPEWITPFAGTGGVIIANVTTTITLSEAKVFSANAGLTINSNATLATNDFALTLGGNFTNNGVFTAGNSPITIAGNAVTQSISGFSTNGLVSMTKSAGTATFQSNVNGVDITINGAGTLNLGVGLTHTFSGIWTRTAGTLNGGSSLLQIGGSVSGIGGTFTAGTGEVEWNALGAQTLAGVSYNILTLSGTGIKTLGGNTTVTGTLNIQGTASLGLGGFTLTYGASSTLAYNGFSPQTSTNAELPASGGPLNLTINNSQGVILHAPRTIAGVFSLINGTLTTSAANLLTFVGATATVDSGSAASFVEGPVAYVYTTTGLKSAKNYPIGKDGIWRPVRLTLTQSTTTSSTYTAEVFNSAPPANNLPPTLANVSSVRHYRISENVGGSAFTAGALQILWGPDDWVTDSPNIRIAQGPEAGGGTWVNLGGTQAAGDVTSTTAFTSLANTIFTLANAIGGTNALPIELASFSQIINGRDVRLNWETIIEKNSNSFVIERTISDDNLNNLKWDYVASVKSAFSSNTPKQYSYIDKNLQAGKYQYRLKMLDNDGFFEYSKVIETEIALPGSFVLSQNYPNPFNPSTKINYNLPNDSKVTLDVYNSIGERVSQIVNEQQSAGYYVVNFGSSSIKNVASGIYLYKLTAVDNAGNNFSTIKKMMLLK